MADRMVTMSRRLKLPMAIIFLVTALGHWPLFFSDSILGDSIVNFDLTVVECRSCILTWYHDYALPIHGVICFLLSYLPSIFFYKLIAFTCLVLIPVFQYRILQSLSVLNDSNKLLLVLLSSSLPIYTMWGEITTLPYLISYACFWMGFYVHLSVMPKWGRLVVQCALWSVAFQLSSLLLFFYAVFAGVWYLKNEVRLAEFDWRSFLKRNSFLLLLPVLYFLLTKIVYSSNQIEYNQFQLSVKGLLKEFIISIYGVVIEPISHLAHFVSVDMNVAIAILVVSILFVSMFFWLALRKMNDFQSRKEPYFWWKLGYGLTLVACATIPYILVGKPIRGFGYESRHALLIGPGVALILLLFLKAIFRNKSIYAAVLILGTFIGMNIISHVLWQNRSIKLSAIFRQLSFLEKPKEKVVFFYDHIPIGTRFKLKNIELHYAMRLAWNNYDLYPYLLNEDLTGTVKRLYYTPVNWCVVYRCPWQLDVGYKVDPFADENLKHRLETWTKRKHNTKINRTYRDIKVPGFDVKIFDATKTRSCTLFELNMNDKWSEGELYFSYLFSDQTEKQNLLNGLINAKAHLISWNE